MPNVTVTIPEAAQSVSRPVIFDIIKQVQEITKMDKDTKIFFPGDIAKMQTPGSSIDSKTDRFAIFNTDRYNFIEVEEDYDITALGTTAVTYREHIPVFNDPKLRVVLTPVYSTSNVVINFKYRCPSKTEALRWRDDIRMRISQMRDINLHDVTYHYPLPLEYLLLLKEIHDNREAHLGYGQTFAEYVTAHCTDRLTLIGDLVNQDTRLVISETQSRIVGIYDFDAVPEKPEREDESGTWTVTLRYKFNYEKPIGCNARYPIMIHNQLLPPQYAIFGKYDLNKVNKSFTYSLGCMCAFESDTIMNDRVDTEYVLRLPSFDDFDIPSVPKGTGSVFVALTEVNTTDNKTLLNLNELGDIELDPDILQFIRESEAPYLGRLYYSILHTSLYRNEYLTSSSTLMCDTALNVKAVANLDLRNQHRVRLSIVTDLTLLTKDALDRLRRYPKALVKIIASINELLRNHPDFTSYGDKNIITRRDFDPVYAMLTGFPLDNGRGTTGEYYGPGRSINDWPYRGYSGGMFADIDPRVVENYRNNRVANNTVMVTGIVAIHREQ